MSDVAPRPRRSADSGQTDLYKHAAQIAKDNLDDQRSEMDSMRGRSVQFLAFVGSATAFLVGTSLDGNTERQFFFGVLGGLGSIGFAILLLILRSLLNGTERWWGGSVMDWHTQQNASLYVQWLDENRGLSPETFYRYLINQVYRQQQLENRRYLERLRRRYVAFIFLGSFLLVYWVWLAWLYGGR